MNKQKKLFPDIDGPKYGIPFKVVGFQAQTEKGKYTELIETDLNYETLKNRREYISWKERLGKSICDKFNMSLRVKWDKIVSFKVRYLCEADDHYI